MNISGLELEFELNRLTCKNSYCDGVRPLCFAGISNNCDRNRETKSWIHLSFGEHICEPCFEIFQATNGSKSKHLTMNAVWWNRFCRWKKALEKKLSHAGNCLIINEIGFIVNSLLPWWAKCIYCKRWRQLPPQYEISTEAVLHFSCSKIFRFSQDPCAISEDERVKLVLKNPQNFFASLKLAGLFQSNPTAYLCPPYPHDLIGLSPAKIPTSSSSPSNDSDENQTSNSGYSTKFAAYRHPFSMPDEFPQPPGSWSPVDVNTWERLQFPHMTRYVTVYLALRNTILFLWNQDPKRLVIPELVAAHLLIRGLIRIEIVDQWNPQILLEFTRLGLINIGLCSCNPRTHLSSLSAKEEKCSLDVRVVGEMDIKSSVLALQLKNYFALQLYYLPVDIRLMSFTAGSTSTDPTTLSPLAVKVRKSGQEEKEELKVESKRPRIDGPISEGIEEILFSRNAWLDRIDRSINNDAALLAYQTGLPTCVEPPVHMFLRSPTMNGEVGRLSTAPTLLTDRIEFHVEALFDQVIYGPSSNLPLPLTLGFKTNSVQDMWDSLDQSIRCQLPDLENSDIEQKLIEFFLAKIEHQIIDSVIASRILIPSMATAFTETSPENLYKLLTSTKSTSEPTVAPISPSCFLDACTILQVSMKNPSLLLSGLSGVGSFPVRPLVQTLTRDLDITEANGLAVILPGESWADGALLLKSGSDIKTVSSIDSILISIPVSSIKIVFCDDPAQELSNKTTTKSNSNNNTSLFSFFLPHQFRLPLQNSSSSSNSPFLNANVKMEEDGDIRVITITLVYSRPWWRSILTGADGYSEVKVKQEYQQDNQHSESPEQFAILPQCREQREFCHTFRDLNLKLPSCGIDEPGILQTKLFATAAKTWWHRSNSDIVEAVANYLRESLNPINCPSLIQSDVHRFQPQLACQHVEEEPHLESISQDDSLVDARVAISIATTEEDKDDMCPLRVEAASTVEFFVCLAWWQMLSEVASIHVLQGLQKAANHTVDIEIRAEESATGLLSDAVTTGLEWAELTLSHRRHQQLSRWSGKRAVSCLRRIAIQQYNLSFIDAASDNSSISIDSSILSNSATFVFPDMSDVSPSSPQLIHSPCESPYSEEVSHRAIRYLKRRVTTDP